MSDSSCESGSPRQSVKSKSATLTKVVTGTVGTGTGEIQSEKMKSKSATLTKVVVTGEIQSEKRKTTLTKVVTGEIQPEKRMKIRERLRQFLRIRPTLETLREKGIFKDEPVFGCNLLNLCSREKSNVPRVVCMCVETIESTHLSADGIYRVCGNLSTVTRLRFEVNQDNFTGITTEPNVHVLTGLLKMFFRDMKEPLLPCASFDPLMTAMG